MPGLFSALQQDGCLPSLNHGLCSLVLESQIYLPGSVRVSAHSVYLKHKQSGVRNRELLPLLASSHGCANANWDAKCLPCGPALQQGSHSLACHHRVALIPPKALLSACKPPHNPRPVATNLSFPLNSKVTKQNLTPVSHSFEPTGNHKSAGKQNIQGGLVKGQT